MSSYWSTLSLKILFDGSDGVKTSLEPSIHEFSRRSMQYFLCQGEIPSWECATSKPRKTI